MPMPAPTRAANSSVLGSNRSRWTTASVPTSYPTTNSLKAASSHCLRTTSGQSDIPSQMSRIVLSAHPDGSGAKYTCQRCVPHASFSTYSSRPRNHSTNASHSPSVPMAISTLMNRLGMVTLSLAERQGVAPAIACATPQLDSGLPSQASLRLITSLRFSTIGSFTLAFLLRSTLRDLLLVDFNRGLRSHFNVTQA